jgi:hypothetical protein
VLEKLNEARKLQGRLPPAVSLGELAGYEAAAAIPRAGVGTVRNAFQSCSSYEPETDYEGVHHPLAREFVLRVPKG